MAKLAETLVALEKDDLDGEPTTEAEFKNVLKKLPEKIQMALQY